MKRAVPVADPLAMLACHLSGPLAAWRSLAEVTTRYSRGVDAAIRIGQHWAASTCGYLPPGHVCRRIARKRRLTGRL